MNLKLSDSVELIINLLNQCRADVRWYDGQQKAADAEIKNLEHELEGVGVEHLVPPNAAQRNKLATRYQKERIKRRVAKDELRVNEPLINFLDSDIGKQAYNQLTQVLGKIRKDEQRMKERVYEKREAPPLSKLGNENARKNLNSLLRKYHKDRKGR